MAKLGLSTLSIIQSSTIISLLLHAETYINFIKHCQSKRHYNVDLRSLRFPRCILNEENLGHKLLAYFVKLAKSGTKVESMCLDLDLLSFCKNNDLHFSFFPDQPSSYKSVILTPAPSRLVGTYVANVGYHTHYAVIVTP